MAKTKKTEKDTEKELSGLDKLQLEIATDINGVAFDVVKHVFGEEVALSRPDLTLDVYERFNADEDDAEEEELTEGLKTALATAKERFGDRATPDIALRYYDHMFTGLSSPAVAEIAEEVVAQLDEDDGEDDEDEE